MKKELLSEEDPLNANLEKNLPSLHEWHGINKHEVSSLKQAASSVEEKMSDIHTKIVVLVTSSNETLKSNKAHMKYELPGTFLEIAKYLVKDASGQVSDSTTLADIVGQSRMPFE
jgi:hypothetical protein